LLCSSISSVISIEFYIIMDCIWQSKLPPSHINNVNSDSQLRSSTAHAQHWPLLTDNKVSSKHEAPQQWEAVVTPGGGVAFVGSLSSHLCAYMGFLFLYEITRLYYHVILVWTKKILTSKRSLVCNLYIY
jgi:hypothetical protein